METAGAAAAASTTAAANLPTAAARGRELRRGGSDRGVGSEAERRQRHEAKQGRERGVEHLAAGGG